MHFLEHGSLSLLIRAARRCPIGTADALDLETGFTRVLVLVHDIVHRLMALAEVAQAIIASDGAMGDAARDQHHFAGLHFVNAELGFDGAVAAKLEVDHVAIDIAVKIVLHAHDAFDADAVIFVFEYHQWLIGGAEHVERTKARRVMGALRRAHQTGLLAFRPTSQTGPGKILPGGHEFANLFLFIDLLFRRFGFRSPVHDSSHWVSSRTAELHFRRGFFPCPAPRYYSSP